ncbi:hypothetical protein GF324_13415, partial [bacterium]|nr:hypothetical protein [bacterium]
ALDRLTGSLSRVSELIAVVVPPHLGDGVLERVELVRLAEGRLLVVLEISGGLVRTVTLDVTSRIRDRDRQQVARVLNHRLGGLTLREIRNTVHERLGHFRGDVTLLRSLIDFSDYIFVYDAPAEAILGETRYALNQPEFSSVDMMRGVIEMLEHRDSVAGILSRPGRLREGVQISIGNELGHDDFNGFSVVVSPFEVDDAHGRVGVIGPKRMDYGRHAAIVHFTADALRKSWQP